MKTISERLHDVIEEKEISYEELEKLSGVPKSAIHRYAKGGTDKIPIDRLDNIAKALNISAAWLMGWEEKRTRPSIIDEHVIEILKQKPMLYNFVLSIINLSNEEQAEIIENCCFLVNQRHKYKQSE